MMVMMIKKKKEDDKENDGDYDDTIEKPSSSFSFKSLPVF